MGKEWKQCEPLFSWDPKSLQMVITAIKLKDTYSLEENTMTNVESILKNRDIFADKSPSSQSYDFPSSHVWISGSEHKESWAPKNWCFWTVSLKKTLESRLDCKRSSHLILKNICPEYSLEGLMLKLKLQCLATWCEEPTHWKRLWCWKALRTGGKGATEDEMVGWHHQLNGLEFEQTLMVLQVW